MTNFILFVDFVMSKRIQVEAESEDNAIAIFEEMMKKNPYEFTTRFDAYVDHEVTDIDEEED